MPSRHDVHIKSARPLVAPNDESDACVLRLGTHLIPTHHGIVEQLPVLHKLATQQDSMEVISVSSLLKQQPSFTPEGLRLALNYAHGKEAFVEPAMVTELLAVANALRMDDLILQVEQELARLALYNDTILFSLEHAVLNMPEQSPMRGYIIQAAALQLAKISARSNFTAIKWPTFEALMKDATDAPAADFMEALIKWANVNRHDQTRACSLLFSSRVSEMNVAEKEHFAKTSASLYLHGVSSTMSKLAGSTPFVEQRKLSHRWSTCSDLSLSSSIDVIAIHEEPFTTTNISVDCSQLSEEGLLYTDVDDSLLEFEKLENHSFFDDLVQEDGDARMGAGADRDESSHLSTASSTSFTHLETKTIDFGTIPIPDGEVKQILLSIELDDDEQSLDYIRKMRFHFDMEVDPKN